MHHSLVEFHVQEPRNKDTCITVTFLSSSVTSSVKITMYVSVPHGWFLSFYIHASQDMLCVVTDGWAEPTGPGVGVRVAPTTDGPTDTCQATVPGSG